MIFDPNDPRVRYAEPEPSEALPGLTEVLPMTPAMRRHLQATQGFQASAYSCGIAFVGSLVAIAIFGLWPAISAGPVPMALAAAVVGAITAGPYVWSRIQAANDLGTGHFTRYSGAFVLRRHTQQSSDDDYPTVTWTLALPEGKVSIDGATAASVQEAGRGEVDYAPNRKLIFEIRDGQGQVLYRRPKLSAQFE